MHNLVELVIGVFDELVQVCFNLLRHIWRRRRGLGPGQNVVKHYVSLLFAANTSWTPSHSSSESSEAMISRSGCCVPARAVAAVCAPALADAAGAVAAVCVPAHADAAVEVSVACHVCAGAARTERQT